MKTVKYWIVIVLLLMGILLTFAFPRVKYAGTNFISELDIPLNFFGWKGRDVSNDLDINVEEFRFNFINDALAHQYTNKDGNMLLFIVLDAGNFHHPNVCFTASGYKIKELPDTTFSFLNHTIKAHTLFIQKDKESFLSFYWIIIDKNIAHEWIEQKLKQLYFSFLNKRRIGLMVRIDIPIKEAEINNARNLANEFIKDLSINLEPRRVDYLLGKRL
jgi:EpsI family protein